MIYNNSLNDLSITGQHLTDKQGSIMDDRRLTQEEEKIWKSIQRETQRRNQLYQKVKDDLGLTRWQRTRGYLQHTCYLYQDKFKVYLTEKDIYYDDYWQFEFAQALYNRKLRLRDRLYAMYKNQAIEVIDQQGYLCKTTPQAVIEYNKHMDVHPLKFINKVA